MAASVSPFNPPSHGGVPGLVWRHGISADAFFRALGRVRHCCLSVLAGLVGGAIIFLFLTKVLISDQEYLDPADFEMVGVLGKLSVPIREGGTGELIYSQMGTRRVCGARSDDGSAIAKGTEVVVTRYEKGIAYVRLWSEMSGELDEARDSEKVANRELHMNRTWFKAGVLLMWLALPTSAWEYSQRVGSTARAHGGPLRRQLAAERLHLARRGAGAGARQLWPSCWCSSRYRTLIAPVR